MAEKSKIEWTDSTFNPWIGCTAISPACDHCYAEAMMSTRMGRVEWGAGKPRSRTSEAYWRQPVRWNARASEFGQCDVCGWRGERGVHVKPDGTRIRWAVCPACSNGLMKPARRRVFCASLADVFDNEVDPNWRADLFDLIARTPNLDWLLLTKRIGNAAEMMKAAKDHWGFSDRPGDWQNVWLGATVVNQPEVDRDLSKLVATPAHIRFLSIEPMLEPVDVSKWLPFLDQVICGGESGPDARPMHPDWVRLLRDQCAAAGVPFLFKQWGEFAPIVNRDGQYFGSTTEAGSVYIRRVGKRAAGRLLDGVEHNGVPEVRHG